jgi:hypothetical protein
MDSVYSGRLEASLLGAMAPEKSPAAPLFLWI